MAFMIWFLAVKNTSIIKLWTVKRQLTPKHC
jgi:hypothetical protein